MSGRRAGIQLRFVPSPVTGVFGSEILLETSIPIALVFEPAGPAAGGVSVIDLRPPLMVPVLALTNPRIWSPLVAEFIEIAAAVTTGQGQSGKGATAGERRESI